MGIVNRRNAVVGWVVLKNRKWIVKAVAREAPRPGTRAGAVAGSALAAICGVVLRRKTRSSGGE